MQPMVIEFENNGDSLCGVLVLFLVNEWNGMYEFFRKNEVSGFELTLRLSVDISLTNLVTSCYTIRYYTST